jgi:hypothetical protein
MDCFKLKGTLILLQLNLSIKGENVIPEHYHHQESSAKGTSSILFISKKKYHHLGADELKRAEIDVKTLTFLQFLLYLSMWCNFNGM